MADAEELRELILSQHARLEALHREAAGLDLLVNALHSMLEAGDDVDPFTALFEVLRPMFDFSTGLAVIEDDADVRCIASTDSALTGEAWTREQIADKALTGRVIATVAQAHPELYLPMTTQRSRGLIILLRPPGNDGFDRHDVSAARRLTLLASQAFATKLARDARADRRHLRRLTTELRQDRDTLAHQVNHDELTGLANRGYFEQRAAEAIANAAPGDELAVLFIDLDGFKQVNDNYGHEVGDQLLIAAANRLREYANGNDVIARVSGDEFVMLVDPMRDQAQLLADIALALTDFRRPFPLGDRQVMVSASVGAALFPHHGRTHNELRRNADIAMYRAKRTARGGVVVYEPPMGDAAAVQLDAEQSLRRAVAQRRFRAVLQPKVNIRNQRICGFEVLARQVDEQGRIGDSASFIGTAIRTGLLDEITGLVVADAIGRIAELDAAFGASTDFSINISTAQATDPRLLASLLSQVESTVYRNRFILEITEDALLQRDVFANKVHPLLRQAGLKVSIDDFGTGYASLSRLLTVTADEIKIDRSFITSIGDQRRSQVVVGALEMIAAELDAQIVAEGVETPAELAYLYRDTTVDIAQGYLFAKPSEVAELTASASELRRRIRQLCASAGSAGAPSAGLYR